jgi:hypothetical protein
MKVSRLTTAATVSLLLLLLSSPSGAAPAGPRGWIEREGTFVCWSAEKGWARTCEISGAARTRRGLVVATDKALENAPGHSHVWRTRMPGTTTPRLAEYTAPPLLDSVKFEGLASDTAGRWCFATTSFSWFVPDDPARADAWNVLAAWREDMPGSAHVVEPTVRDGVVSSISLLPRMRAALVSPRYPKGPGWFKIEGLAVLPGRRLAFGIRALGDSYKSQTMVGIVIAVPYAVCKGRIRIVGPFKKIVEWDASAVVGKAAGVSGLAYDAAARRLLLLTSYEARYASKASDLDGWAWVLPYDRLRRGGTPAVVRDGRGAPLRFRHKPEAIVKAGRNRYLVIHDDDRVHSAPAGTGARGGSRPKNEASYAYLRLCRSR